MIRLIRKEFTSFDVAAVVRELKDSILNSRVINIYQLKGKDILLKLRGKTGELLTLMLRAGKSLHLTLYMQEKPLTPPAFCMALRKYLRGSWLVDVEQYEFERIVTLRFKSKTGALKLILELFGDGNIILVGSNGKILQALIYKRMRDRNILKGEVFLFPPSSGRNPIKISVEELLEGLKSFGELEVVRALARFLGLGGVYAEEILLRLGIDKTTKCNVLSYQQVESIYNCLKDMISQVMDRKLEPCIVLDDGGNFVDVTPLKLKRYEGLKHEAYGSFNEALDEFYSRITVLEEAAAVEREIMDILREIERLRRVMGEQEKALEQARQKAERYKRIGDIIYVYSMELQNLLSKFLEGEKSGKNWDDIINEVLAAKRMGLKPDIYFETFDKKSLSLMVHIEDLSFPLDLRRSLFENAARFYEESKIAGKKLEGAKEALEDTRNELREAEAKLREAELRREVKPKEALEKLAKRKVKSRKWFEKFRWFISSDGFLVLAGRDASSNEALIKRYTQPGDVVFHADVAGAPFVVIKTEGKQPSEQCLKEAAEFAAAFSRGWREGFASVDVYWVNPEQLSKTGEPGEYVPRGAFVVRGKRNWMRNTPLKMAIGAFFNGEKGEISFIGGPVDAVKAKTKNYVILVPGDVNGRELSKDILKILAAKMPKDQQPKALEAYAEEIRSLIPYGKGKISFE